MATQDNDWKRKYLDALDDLEKAQQLEKKRLEVMRKGIVRVSVAADGQDAALDANLSDLRAAMRSQREVLEIEPLIYQLEQTVKTLDTRRRQSSDDIGKLLEDQLERYLALNLERREKGMIKRFRKLLPDLMQPGREAELWQGFGEIVDTILLRHQQGSSAGKGGLLQRLFGTKEAANPVVVQEAAVPSATGDWPEEDGEYGDYGEATPEQVLARAEMDLTSSGQGDDQREEIKARISRILQQLLEQIEVPTGLAVRREQLLARLQLDYPWESLPDLLAETSELVASLRAMNQREFGAFLVALHQRLADIQAFLLTTRQGEEDAQRQHEQFDAEVQGELSNFQATMLADNDINRIRDGIESMMTRIMGVMTVFRQREDGRRAEVVQQMQDMMARMQTMEQEADELRRALESQRDKALRDGLTGLPNRMALEEQIQREFSRWRRHGHPWSIAVVDVDFFKRINDSLGHLRGDRVLKLVGREVQKRVRGEDFVARFGGEEFVVLLPETDEASAVLAMEKVRGSIEALPFNFNNERVVVTVSIGISQWREGDTPESCFERADRALYQAKHAGRNRVVVAEAESGETPVQ